MYDKSKESGESSKREVSGIMEMPEASLVWFGDENSRPFYIGPGTQPEISPRMDSLLNNFLRLKNMDTKMFTSLIQGKLMPKSAIAPTPPPASATTTGGTAVASSSLTVPAGIDPETLKQAALLQQMKTSFGSTACLQAMMLLMSNESGTNNTGGSGGSVLPTGTAAAASPSPTAMMEMMMKMKSEQQQTSQPQLHPQQQQTPAPTYDTNSPEYREWYQKYYGHLQ